MIECLIVGDSIAVGVHQHRPECIAYTKVGINSRDWNNRYLGKTLTAKTAIISIGSNDHAKIKTLEEAADMRQSIDTSGLVYWIIPMNHDKAAIVKHIAKTFGDVILYIPEVSKDGVHPTAKAYKQLAEQTK